MTHEQIFDKIAKSGMSQWELKGFKRTYPSLFKVIMLSMQAAKEEAMRWIPVSEKMPQKGQQVLVIGDREAELYPASGKPSVGCVYWNTAQSSPCSDTCFYSFGYTNITHWMPIPELPKPTQP